MLNAMSSVFLNFLSVFLKSLSRRDLPTIYGERMKRQTDSEAVLRERVREIMHAKHLTPSALAKHMGQSAAWASQFLGGRNSVPVKSLGMIAAFLETPVADLFRPDPLRHSGAASSHREEAPNVHPTAADLSSHAPDPQPPTTTRPQQHEQLLRADDETLRGIINQLLDIVAQHKSALGEVGTDHAAEPALRGRRRRAAR